MNNEFKTELFNQLQKILTSKINDAEQAIASAKESRNNDTKSSAGDKYETGRAMMQMEIENNELQLNKALQQQQELMKIELDRKYHFVETGSLVITNHENYFISIPMGKIHVGNHHIYAISLVSPIGMILKDKKEGDRVEFMGRELIIESIS